METNNQNSLKRCATVAMMMSSECEDELGPIPPVQKIIAHLGISEHEYWESMALSMGLEEKVEDVIINENETALFEYKVEEYFNLICSWRRNGILIESDERTIITKDGVWHRLEIKEVTFDDQGIYTIECEYEQTYISVKSHLYVTPRCLRDAVYYHKKPFAIPGVNKHLPNTKLLIGETLTLGAEFNFKSEYYTWYKNNKKLNQDQRITIIENEISPSISISNVNLTDTGVYYVVARTIRGVISSFADVEVGTSDEKRAKLPIIEEHPPEDIEALFGEETRLVLKARTDSETSIRWELNNVPIKSKDYVMVDYGNNYIGLNILNPVKSSVGEYKVILINDKLKRVVSTETRLTLNLPPVPPPAVKLVRHLESAVACCGAKVSFDCSFNLENPIYFYVVWYVGHYKVERTNSLFNVICGGGQFLLYINKVEPSMAGEVICELRRAFPNRKSVSITKSHANLVIIPQALIKDMKKFKVHESKLYFVRESPGFSFRIEENNFDTSAVANFVPIPAPETTWTSLLNELLKLCRIPWEALKFFRIRPNMFHSNAQPPKMKPVPVSWDILLQVACCRLDDNGLFFAHVTRGPNTAINTKLEFLEGTNNNSKKHTVVKWSDYIISAKTWFGIDVLQPNGSFSSAAITSQPQFVFMNPPLLRMFIFRIRGVKSEPQKESFKALEVFIVLPKEIVLRQSVLQEIQPMEAFEKIYKKTDDLIGAGSFGNVVMVQNKDDGHLYAAKFVKARVGSKRDQTLREFHIMKKLHHPKLIQLIGFYESSLMIVFVMEYCWGGELFDRVAGDEFLKEVDVVGYVMQICQALEYLHKNSIVHLDLKPENIICLSPNSRQVKLIDFGLARNLNEDYLRTIYGTKEYMAPELIDFEPISTASDMWSLGVVTYILLSGLMPFGGDSWVERSVNITRVIYQYDDIIFNDISNTAKHFVDSLLLRQPEKRMTASEALQHKWFKEERPKGPKGTKVKHLTKMRENLKSYLADYRSRWQRAGNVMIAAHRLRMRARNQTECHVEMPDLF